ncbi:exonuclease 1-like [Folsomia candida]|uniref:exonuclease 1-like n=1 Tax=Folsomia candida TaxID=158441 RepID=UPI00160557BC|nr:exonuclease 1-like [Folsomia candida]
MSESESEEEIDSDKEDEEKSGQVQPFTAIVPKLKDLFIKMKVNFIVSPYESDPQLTNMFRSGMIDVVVSEDSDFIMHQCETLYKLDSEGYGLLYQKSEFVKFLKLKNQNKFEEVVRWTCLVAGTDYFSSPYGVGFGAAKKLIPHVKIRHFNEFIQLVIDMIPEVAEMQSS